LPVISLCRSVARGARGWAAGLRARLCADRGVLGVDLGHARARIEELAPFVQLENLLFELGQAGDI